MTEKEEKIKEIISRVNLGFSQTKKFFERTEKIVVSSKQEAFESSETILRIEQSNELFSKQILNAENFLEKIIQREETLKQNMDQINQTFFHTSTQLTHALQQLKDTQLENSTMTLYDFVEDETITMLNQECSSQMQMLSTELVTIGTLRKNVQVEVKELKELYQEINEKCSKSPSFDPMENISEQSRLFTVLSEIRFSVTSLHDRLIYAWKERQKTPIELDFVYSHANKLPGYLSTIYENSSQIEQLGNDLEVLVTERNKLKELCMKLLDQFERFYSKSRKVVQRFDQMEFSFLRNQDNCNFLIEELEKLLLCYQKYFNSYPELLRETNRRKEYEKNISNRVQTFQKQLLESWNEENEKRNRWEKEASVYLPASLGSHLSQQPSRYEIKKI